MKEITDSKGIRSSKNSTALEKNDKILIRGN
jgi:hypothetical protein